MQNLVNPKNFIFTNKGYVEVKTESDPSIINMNGVQEKSSNIEYKNLDKFYIFNTYFSTDYETKISENIKLLCLKNPFGLRKSVKSGVLKLKSKLHLFDESKLEYLNPSFIEEHDYLVRYVGRFNPIKDIETIDLAPFSDRFDDLYVYEQYTDNRPNPLGIKTIYRATGLSQNYILSIRRKEILQKRSKSKFKKLNNYLDSIGKTIEDFYNYTGDFEIKYNRYLKIDEDFCYVLGFYLGDGWYRNACIGFGLHSLNNDEQTAKLKKYFSGFRTYDNFSKKRKLLQFFVNSRIFAKLFKSLVPDFCSKKVIPDGFLDLPDNKLISLFEGLKGSDGSVCSKEGIRVSFDSTSITLAFQYKWIAEYLGYTCRMAIRNQIGCAESYKISYVDRVKQQSTGFNNKKYLFIKVRSKELINKQFECINIKTDSGLGFHADNFIILT